jgi:GNAT superfamily N-acetyltransferase
VEIADFGLDSPAEWLDAWHRLDVATSLETLPGLEPPTAAESRGELLSDFAYHRRGLAAIDGGMLVGAIALEESMLEDLDTAYAWLLVDAAYRRRGVGTRLLDAATELLRANGRTRLDSSVLVGSPASAFAKARGARVTQIETPNVLDLTTLDLATLSANAQPRSPYLLTTWTDGCPDDLVDAYAVAHAAMDDAPHGVEKHDDAVWSAERVRGHEECWASLGHRTLTTAAVHTPTGMVAGYTVLLLTGRPTTAIQEDTGVVRAHRGHGLGRAMKAANLLALIEHSPAITTVVTWNAESNTHMLAVNDELGFRPHSRWEEVTLEF